MTGPPLLEVRGLTVEFRRATGKRPVAGADPAAHRAVDGLDLDLLPGETLGLIGESGSGKTSTALALLGLLPGGARAGGRALWRGRDLLSADADALRAIRGAEIALVPQDPMAALHPLMRVERQVAEAVRAHAQPGKGRAGRAGPAAARDRAAELLTRTGLPPDRLRHARYAFEWSGGMRQRALIAMAVAHSPALLIADEPTAALDATTQAEILALLRRLRDESGMAMLLISHDMAAVAAVADRVAVLRRGRIIETGSVEEVCRSPREPYTAGLVDALPPPPGLTPPPRPPSTPPRSHGRPGPGIDPVLRARGVTVRYPVRRRDGGRWFTAVDDVSFDLPAGETLCVVGESGAGKSSLARALLRIQPAAGRVDVCGRDFTTATGEALRRARRDIQIVFQDPYASLNPRRRVGPTVTEPLRIHRLCSGGDAPRLAATLLESVGLPAAHADRFPFELSGGERQRVAIARALALHPRVIVLDEPVSALDVPTRGAIVALLAELQERHGLAYLLIAHDLRFVRRIAHRVAVMHGGRLVETGSVHDIFERPGHPYTRALVAAVR
jgi:peptide/nickel transport system ATP-binding protein